VPCSFRILERPRCILLASQINKRDHQGRGAFMMGARISHLWARKFFEDDSYNTVGGTLPAHGRPGSMGPLERAREATSSGGGGGCGKVYRPAGREQFGASAGKIDASSFGRSRRSSPPRRHDARARRALGEDLRSGCTARDRAVGRGRGLFNHRAYWPGGGSLQAGSRGGRALLQARRDGAAAWANQAAAAAPFRAAHQRTRIRPA
jgi:hypothetical protein